MLTVHDLVLPWPVIGLVFLLFTAYGLAGFFYADHIYDWQIRRLQSRALRRFSRWFSLFVMAIGLIGVFFMIQAKL